MQNTDGATDGNPVDGGHNISANPLYNPNYTLQAGSPCVETASDGKDMGALFNECERCEPPTLITLSFFTAIAANRQVVIKWATESEIENGGFNIYRATAENGEYTKINALLILAEGSPAQGTSYEFIDDDVQNRIIYYYKLEDIDLNGTATFHGPVSATPRLICGIGK